VEIEEATFRIKLCQKGGPQKIQYSDIENEKLPERFKKIKWEKDADSIRKALESGEDISDIAVLLPRENYLKIT
jgi:hypothetical protein